MPYFQVSISRTQIQSESFTVEAKDKKELEKILNEIDLTQIDQRFDESQVESIEYDINFIVPSKKPIESSFADEDLQELINE